MRCLKDAMHLCRRESERNAFSWVCMQVLCVCKTHGLTLITIYKQNMYSWGGNTRFLWSSQSKRHLSTVWVCVGTCLYKLFFCFVVMQLTPILHQYCSRTHLWSEFRRHTREHTYSMDNAHLDGRLYCTCGRWHESAVTLLHLHRFPASLGFKVLVFLQNQPPK